MHPWALRHDLRQVSRGVRRLNGGQGPKRLDMIQWTASMRSGVESVDQQHRRLIGILNDLLRNVSCVADPKRSCTLLRELQEYAQLHFCHEEQCMDRYRCPAAAKNRAEHLTFKQTIREFEQRFRTEGASRQLELDMERYLAGWVLHHMAGTDCELARCVGDEK
jgi:hemerythrin-like metal-binding protein